jgi:L-asparaginase
MHRNNTPLDIALLTTGGTFEKVYDPQIGALCFRDSQLASWQTQCYLPLNTRLETVMLVDSLDMTDEQRLTLCARIQASPENRVVVIHGTDTLVTSALAAYQAKRPDQVVVFTGAMVPAFCAQSDALFNLGMAIAAVQCQPAGVWVACSGKIFDARHVKKDRAQGRFVSLGSSPPYLPIQN